MNFYLVARRWTSNVIWRWWKGWERQWGEKGLIFGGGEKLVLLHNNVPVHSPLSIFYFLTKCETMLTLCTLYSADLAPVDFFLFTKLKFLMKEWRFESVKEIKENCWQSYALFRKRIPGMLPKLEETLGGMYKEWRIVLQQW